MWWGIWVGRARSEGRYSFWRVGELKAFGCIWAYRRFSGGARGDMGYPLALILLVKHRRSIRSFVLLVDAVCVVFLRVGTIATCIATYSRKHNFERTVLS